MVFRYEIPDISDTPSTADWIEFYLIATSNPFSRAEFLDYLESTTGLEADEIDQGQIDSVWSELERREKLYGAASPFNVDGPVIRHKFANWKQCSHYLMCVIFSLEGNDHVTGYTPAQSGKLFEDLVRITTEKFMHGTAYVYGYPSDSLTTFSGLSPLMSFLQEPPSDLNDGGMDVIGFGPFNDGRRNALSIIIQCAAGKNWRDKIDDVNLDEWGKWLDLPFRPTKGFAAPIVMRDRDIGKKSTRMGLLIDRPRILRATRNDDIESIRSDIESWCESRLQDLVL